MSESHQGWVASLSDGTTVFQSPDVPGELTAWQQLRHRCMDDGELHVTQIQLQTGGQTIVGLANADGYVAFYEAHLSVARSKNNKNRNAPKQRLYQGVGAVFGDFVFIILANHEGTFMSDVRTLASMQEHCQLKPAGASRRQDERPLLNPPEVTVVDLAEQE